MALEISLSMHNTALGANYETLELPSSTVASGYAPAVAQTWLASSHHPPQSPSVMSST